MARRKRLSPFATDDSIPADLEVKSMFPLAASSRPAPIADMAGAAAATAAMQEMADTLRLAREQGRMVLALPLDQIEAGYLVRDRISADPEEMAALVESLRARGQQTPIEVAQLGPDRYGLISGWRRLTALRRLQGETGDPQFGLVLALMRRPDQAADAYVAMVEENEIRVGLSFWERARIVARAVEAGVYPDDREALRGLFGAASRPKRSKIGSFLVVVRALDGALRFPESIGERLGLQLAQRLEAQPGLADTLRARLMAAPPADAPAEQVVLSAAGEAPAGVKPPAPPTTDAGAEIAPGIRLHSFAPGRLVLTGPGVDADFQARLAGWLQG